MNFSELKAELAARGFDYLSDTRRGQYVNAGYHEFNEEDLWSWRVDTDTGSSPLTVSDLGVIEEVVDTGNNSRPLVAEDRRNLRDWYGDLTTTGTPEFFYRDGATTVRTYPVGGTLSLRHFKLAADLTGTDTPIIPTRYHLLIVDYAARRAYNDSDNQQAAGLVEAEIQRQLHKVRQSDLQVQVANPWSTSFDIWQHADS